MSDRSLIRLKGVTKRYGGVFAVNDVSMEVMKGERLALVGANGAGKSTVFNLMAGAVPPTQGAIEAFGEDVTRRTDWYMCRAGLARTFQVVRPLEGMSVVENVMVGAFLKHSNVRVARARAMEALDRIGLADSASVMADNLTLTLRKRLEVARALATEPNVLLLDEMMSGLNPAELDKFLEVLRAINRDGVTLVIVEHVMRAVTQLADRVIVMNQGGIIASGGPHVVMRDPAVIEAYLGENYVIA